MEEESRSMTQVLALDEGEPNNDTRPPPTSKEQEEQKQKQKKTAPSLWYKELTGQRRAPR